MSAHLGSRVITTTRPKSRWCERRCSESCNPTSEVPRQEWPSALSRSKGHGQAAKTRIRIPQSSWNYDQILPAFDTRWDSDNSRCPGENQKWGRNLDHKHSVKDLREVARCRTRGTNVFWSSEDKQHWSTVCGCRHACKSGSTSKIPSSHYDGLWQASISEASTLFNSSTLLTALTLGPVSALVLVYGAIPSPRLQQ